ncbi:hypothetical protein EVAR_18003_1 [Eumeta japonica]|uniref:Uncharacterized protein n=1 Tax=Eumeta variegata TaxID=151549 RepID=A0A4C1Y6V8_EUMVA|nr:hypothetical protein EVAR_18003_1 [Eumeta japonica]
MHTLYTLAIATRAATKTNSVSIAVSDRRLCCYVDAAVAASALPSALADLMVNVCGVFAGWSCLARFRSHCPITGRLAGCDHTTFSWQLMLRAVGVACGGRGPGEPSLATPTGRRAGRGN